jgi:two-component system OmpR family response regulator
MIRGTSGPGQAALPDSSSASAAGRVLVVDDDTSVREPLSEMLRLVGFDVCTASSGIEALIAAQEWRPDLAVLDVGLPDLDGFEVTRQLRTRENYLPIVFLSARSDMSDKLTGLAVGGDDYITKPFSLEEIVARIRAVLRRTHSIGGVRGDDNVLRFADLELELDTCYVRRTGRLITLSLTEFKLLRYLMVNAERVLSKEQIINHVWRHDFTGDARIVESFICLLRKKVDKGNSPLIQTLRGQGYSLRMVQKGSEQLIRRYSGPPMPDRAPTQSDALVALRNTQPTRAGKRKIGWNPLGNPLERPVRL